MNKRNIKEMEAKLQKYIDDTIPNYNHIFLLEDYFDETLSLQENKKIIDEAMQSIFKSDDEFVENNIKLLKEQEQANNERFRHERQQFNKQMMNINKDFLELSTILKDNSVVGVAGNRNTAKTSLVLNSLINLKNKYKDLNVYALGINTELQETLNKHKIYMLNSTMDILDLKITNSVIYIDEFALLFSTQNKNKQLDKLMRFFDRIEHQNCKLIISTAREGFYNKFMCSRINAFLVKEIEYDALVNGTWLKERIKAITSTSDYRLDCANSDYYLVGNDLLTSKHHFTYNKEIDTKKNNINLFK